MALDVRHDEPRTGSKQHLRARVALEERRPRLPARVVRLPYRLLVPSTALLAEPSLHRVTARED